MSPAVPKARKRRRRTWPTPPPPTWSDRLYVRVPPREMAFLKFLIEGYDNLGYATVVDRFSAVLQIIFAPGQEPEVRELLDAVGPDLGLEIVRLAPPAA